MLGNMKKLKVALVGRPNVGKSALFNRICGQKIAIVDEAEGVTRDRLYADAEFFGHRFQVIDTGGIDPHSKIPFQEEVRRQTEIAIEEADRIIMVVDATVGITLMDEEVAKLLLRKEKEVCLAVNKVDDFGKQNLLHQFYSLGITKIVAISASHGFQISELIEHTLAGIAPVEAVAEEHRIKIAIVGRPNVGKSTLVNYLLTEERCVVSPIAGTTRDSVDIPFSSNGIDYMLIDTAGIRRKRAEHDVVDKFAAIRTERAIDRAHICILMLDAQQGMTAQEKRIADQIEEAGKGCILVFNKWDLVKGFRMEHCMKGIQEEVPFLSHCPTFFTSAIKGRNVQHLLPKAHKISEDLKRRVTTGQLNKFLEKAIQKCHPAMIQGKRLRIYYIAQVDVSPPRFVMFVNNPDLMIESYKKYLIHQFRDSYGFEGVPIIFALKGRKQKEESAPAPAEEPSEEE